MLERRAYPSSPEKKNVYPDRTIVAQDGPNGQYMVCIGIDQHTHDPNNPFFTLYTHELAQYFMKTAKHPEKRMAIIEGYPLEVETPLPFPTDPEVVMKGGEMYALAVVAEVLDMPCISAEPKNYRDIRQASQEFSVEAAMLYSFMRLGPQMYREGILEEEQMRAYLQPRLDHIKETLSDDHRFAQFDASYDNLTALFSKAYKGRVFSTSTPEDSIFFKSETFTSCFPVKRKRRDSVIRKVARVVNQIRDEESLALHQKYWSEGWSIISLAGKIHVDNNKDELEKLGTPTRSSTHLGLWLPGEEVY